MAKTKWLDVWVCQDKGGGVSVWDGTMRKPEYDSDMWCYPDGDMAGLMFDEGFPKLLEAKPRKPGWFARKYGADKLPGEGKCVGMLIEV